MQMGRDLGMSLLDQALLSAISAREIDPDDAYNYALEKKAFQKYVTDTSMLPKVDVTGAGADTKPTSPASA
jgi:twitching motility protein PilT